MTKFAALIVLLLAAPASAQTVEGTFDLSALGWGLLETPVSVELDGNPQTQEWLVRHALTLQYRAVAIDSHGQMCAGAWFRGTAPDAFLTQNTVQRINGVDKIVSSDLQNRVTIVHVEMPRCDH